MENPILKIMSLNQIDYEVNDNPIYRMDDTKFFQYPKMMNDDIVDNSMNLMGMNSVPINVMFILNKINSNGLKVNDEFDLNNLIITIHDSFRKEESLEKKKFIMK